MKYPNKSSLYVKKTNTGARGLYRYEMLSEDGGVPRAVGSIGLYKVYERGEDGGRLLDEYNPTNECWMSIAEQIRQHGEPDFVFEIILSQLHNVPKGHGYGEILYLKSFQQVAEDLGGSVLFLAGECEEEDRSSPSAKRLWGKLKSMQGLEHPYTWYELPFKLSRYNGLDSQKSDSYRIQHTAPDEDAAPLWDVTSNGVYPEDFYGRNGLRYYGTGSDVWDRIAHRIIKSARGFPDEHITIYRAVPEGVEDINEGDWVTVVRGYAQQHALDLEGPGLDGLVVQKEVFASDLFTDGNSMLEWGYYPR